MMNRSLGSPLLKSWVQAQAHNIASQVATVQASQEDRSSGFEESGGGKDASRHIGSTDDRTALARTYEELRRRHEVLQ